LEDFMRYRFVHLLLGLALAIGGLVAGSPPAAIAHPATTACTTTHHDGFAMWPTKANDWNLRSRSGFQRDLLAELATEARANGIKFGVYYSIWDWHNPLFTSDFPAYVTQMKAGISPDIIINNRVGKRRAVDGDYGTPEQALPSGPPSAQLEESCMTINDTWGYAAWDTNFKSPATLVRNLVQLTSTSSNYLLNIGPTDTGAISTGQANALKGVGDWMARNGTTIYGGGFTDLVAQPGWGRVIRKGGKLYLVVYGNWGQTIHLSTKARLTLTGARVLDTGAAVTLTRSGDGYDLTPTGASTSAIANVIEADLSVPGAAPAGTGTGLKAEFWNNTTFSGTPVVTRTDATLNYASRYGGSPGPAINTDNFSSRWTGSIQPRYSEQYTFTTASDDTVQVWIDGKLVVANTTPHAPAVDQGSITLVAGRRYDIKVEQTENGGEAFLKLIWSSPSTPAQIVPASQLYATAGRTHICNDNASGVTYSGGWNVSSFRGLGDYADDVHYSTANGSLFTYTFTGTGADLLTEAYSDEGDVDIYVDGIFKTTSHLAYGARLPQVVAYSATGLAPGTHTLKGVKVSGTYMLVDRLDVTS